MWCSEDGDRDVPCHVVQCRVAQQRWNTLQSTFIQPVSSRRLLFVLEASLGCNPSFQYTGRVVASVIITCVVYSNVSKQRIINESVFSLRDL